MDTELDVIVFECGDRRFALELHHVQEVITLAYVTPVPLAPPSVQGATNVRGRMAPVITLQPFFATASPPAVLPGASAILLGVGDAVAALPVERVVDVLSVSRRRFESGGEGSGPLVPGSFRGPAGSVPLLDIEAVIERIREASAEASRQINARSEAR
ncbi:MAG: chemotaxis protein CheW [Polyangia bacterium]|jgi:purine-binding chemotaxis protein CheW|nr:chemotaxis protein CheW [Polyangia bacterium]